MSPKKGPFWVIDSNETIVAYPVDADMNPVPSHKNVWDDCKGSVKDTWNYYPRGRVEIKRGKVIVFLNERCLDRRSLENDLRKTFDLGIINIEFKIDHSAHYTKGLFGD